MLSLAFWASLVAVFFALKWVASGLLELAEVQVRAVRPATVTPLEPQPLPGKAFRELDRAA